MQVDEEADWFFVDSGLTYEGPPASSFSGLGHLEGKVVAVLGDGQVVFDGDPSSPRAAAFTVTGGAIAALGASYSKVHAGLPIRFAEVQFLSIDVQGVAIREKRKQVRAISLVLDQSSISFWAGRDLENLIKTRPEAWEVAATRTPRGGCATRTRRRSRCSQPSRCSRWADDAQHGRRALQPGRERPDGAPVARRQRRARLRARD
jgi:hypothetical protein